MVTAATKWMLFICLVAGSTLAYDIEFLKINVNDVVFSVASVQSDSTKETILLLHGFPEGWTAWLELIPYLANNYNLIIPDQRGFNQTSKPPTLDSYTINHLTDDIAALIQYISPNKPVHLVGHDWGGFVAWTFASLHPTLILDLTILNAGHPNIFIDLLKTDPQQQSKSQYILFFVQPIATDILSLNNFTYLQSVFANETWFTPTRVQDYLFAWNQDLEINSTLNWYRANIHPSGGAFNPELVSNIPDGLKISVPTLVLWGEMDKAFVLPANIDRLTEYVGDGLLTVKMFPMGTHWLAHEFPKDIADVLDMWISSRKE